MRLLIAVLATLSLAGPSAAQAPASKELKAFIVSVDDSKITVSNVALGPAGGGQTFVMPAPKEGAPPPTWVAASPASPVADGEASPRPKMMMITQADDKTPLTLTELQTSKGAVKASEFPAGTNVVITYREVDGKKALLTIERAVTK